MSDEKEQVKEITEDALPLPMELQEAPPPLQEDKNTAKTDTFNFTEAVLMALNEE